MSLLGVDVGTSGCKSVLFSEDGEALAAAYEEYEYRRPRSGWVELDTRRVWEQVQSTICRASAGARRDPVRALAVSSLGEAVVPVTEDRRILGPSILNFDARGAEFLPGLRERMPATRLYAINGNALGNNYSLTKLLWLKRHRPALYRQARTFLHWSSFVAYMLGAGPAVDYSLASRTLLFDLQSQSWSTELLDWAGLDGEKLPPTIPSGTVIGELSRQAAETLGLPAGIPISSGAHDQCCAALGCGVVSPGQAMYGIGTFICMVPVFPRRPAADAMMAGGFNTEHHAAPGQFVSFIYNQGGSLVRWFRDTFAGADRQAAAPGADLYAALMDEMPPGPSRAMALPHFTTTGPPDFIDDSCGLIAGLYLDTPRGEILKGLLESATFYLRECLELLPRGIAIDHFRASGGGSKSDAWLQISADILGRPFTRMQVQEAGALGAAILGGAGCGIFSSVEEGAARMVRPGQAFLPDPRAQARYDERYARYRQLGPLLRDYLRDLAAG